ncbi:heat shock factor protein 5 [Archocentrus centrarchus]|uniref:heat shock factor protein 5 n=1 Tax=Archocentrus centrarchus TaxID=63155 RepID=UPI0011E9DA04|nr:heat shock factor protein 5 [Archocentrus centrarchus]
MEVGLGSLPDTINPNHFPAKLWRLVNNPANKGICWDHHGELVVIDQQVFEREVLSPSAIISDSTEAFKTTNFSSFVRQLNLYGFKKADGQTNLDMKVYHCFYNPSFKRDHPELVAKLRRLTVDNKAKLEAGLSVNCRPPSGYQRFCLNGGDRDKHVRGVSPGGSLLLSPTIPEASPPYYPHKSQAMKSYSGTPVPPRYLMRGHPYTGVTSSSNAVNFQQSLLAQTNHRSPNFTSFSPCNVQYQPGYCSSGYHCYHPNLVAPHIAGGGFQAGLFSPQSYYQAGCSGDMLFLRENSQGLQKNENQEAKNYDINLEAVFQIADEVMQTPPSICLVKVEPQEELVPAPESSANACYDSSSGSTIRSDSFCAERTIVSSNHPIVAYKEQQECVVSVPEQMPDDAIVEVTTDDARDRETAAGDSPGDSSQEL